ncbi:unnamed protein product [Urochloa humidicola]
MDGEDRLSALSDDLLRHILYFVPFKESTSTSVLSRRRGSLWRSSGAVNLAVRVKGNDTYQYHQSVTAREAADEAFSSYQEAFAAVAAEAPVTRLTLRVDTDGDDAVINRFLYYCRGWLDVDVVGDVLSHDVARRVEHLRIDLVDTLDACRIFSDREIDRCAGIYRPLFLPSAETLRMLDLTRCDLEPLLALATFPRLATLRMRLCTVQLDHLQALLDAAPELTTVRLESVFFKFNPNLPHVHAYDQLDVDGNATDESPVVGLSFRAVTTLALELCGRQAEGGHANSWWALEIDAPRLRSFVYEGLLQRFLLRSAASGLTRVDLHFLQDEYYKRRSYYDKERARVLFWQFLHNVSSQSSSVPS